MDPTSELLLRNVEGLSGSILLINPPDDGLMDALPAGLDTCWFSQDFATASRLSHSDEPAQRFGPLPERSRLASRQPVLRLPREKARLELLCRWLAASLSGNQGLWLVGHNREGIKSAPKVLKRHFQQVSKIDAARHCVIWQADTPLMADENFNLAGEYQWFEHDVAGTSLGIAWLPGVFARQGVDDASALMIGTFADLFDHHAPERVLDVGCRGGILATAAAVTSNRTGKLLDRLVCSDSYALALEASRQTLARNGVEGTVIPSDVYSSISGRFDLILSNPPFHQGRDQDFRVPQALIREAPGYLGTNGRLRIVANRHLPYRGWMQKIFRQVELIAENRSFVVLEGAEPLTGQS